ncbi:hypothetical protein FraEuI1c_5081 [Pseudofrankia inefficax]|uniref:DUF4388 domain-containing protein n=1 Tax=Pseudofrankia inefficax (strain DSM 45817 / CECT 9037 / DDB 130130 / EuI1c) TaxID=298654 RepID=E3J4F1_PSEI1|nr:hypothetical protein FraEuI1c_5081 [Pseudofrankia inefficax]
MGSDLLLSGLYRLGETGFSGVLRVEGARVGGTITLSSGLVIAADTAAAPGLESLLLRSGRVSGEDWTETFADAAPRGELRAALVQRGLLGSASIQVLTQTAAVDAVFALALAEVHSCVPEPAGSVLPPLVPISPGMDVGRIVRETHRRLAVVAGWYELGLDPRVRPWVTTAAPPVDQARAEVLARVNGRRTSRDIAFLLGRGLFAVMSDLAVLLQDGQIALAPPTTAATSALAAASWPTDAGAPTSPAEAASPTETASPAEAAAPGPAFEPTDTPAGPRRRLLLTRRNPRDAP